jgi:hypothetical protein
VTEGITAGRDSKRDQRLAVRELTGEAGPGVSEGLAFAEAAATRFDRRVA